MMPPSTVEMIPQSCGDITLLHFPLMEKMEGFVHAVTTRPWNLSVHHGPETTLAVERRRWICRHLGLSFDRLTVPEQIHSAHVLRIRSTDVGAGRDDHRTAVRFVDGLVCDMPGVPLMQLSADCPLILAVDPVRRAFGTAHASWRGTVAQIAVELVHQLRQEFGSRPEDLVVGIGPCAGPAEYVVGEDVRRIAIAKLTDAERFFPTVAGRLCFDLREANRIQLLGTGVQADRMNIAPASTIGDRRFFSHRRDGPTTGRFALIAGFA